MRCIRPNFGSKVDKFVPRAQAVNLRIVCDDPRTAPVFKPHSANESVALNSNLEPLLWLSLPRVFRAYQIDAEEGRNLTIKPQPESSRDCLAGAIFARQRSANDGHAKIACTPIRPVFHLCRRVCPKIDGFVLRPQKINLRIAPKNLSDLTPRGTFATLWAKPESRCVSSPPNPTSHNRTPTSYTLNLKPETLDSRP